MNPSDYRNENIEEGLVEVEAVEICHMAIDASHWPHIAAVQRSTKEGRKGRDISVCG